MALRDWLTAHAYVIPADIEPVIDAYVKQHSDFIAPPAPSPRSRWRWPRVAWRAAAGGLRKSPD